MARMLLALCTMIAFTSAIAAEPPEIFPSPKYPDYPFSEAVAYNGVLYLSGDLGARVELECMAALPETKI